MTLNKLKDNGIMSHYALSKFGINGPSLKRMIKYEIILEVVDPLTLLPAYKVNDGLFG